MSPDYISRRAKSDVLEYLLLNNLSYLMVMCKISNFSKCLLAFLAVLGHYVGAYFQMDIECSLFD